MNSGTVSSNVPKSNSFTDPASCSNFLIHFWRSLASSGSEPVYSLTGSCGVSFLAWFNLAARRVFASIGWEAVCDLSACWFLKLWKQISHLTGCCSWVSAVDSLFGDCGWLTLERVLSWLLDDCGVTGSWLVRFSLFACFRSFESVGCDRAMWTWTPCSLAKCRSHSLHWIIELTCVCSSRSVANRFLGWHFVHWNGFCPGALPAELPSSSLEVDVIVSLLAGMMSLTVPVRFGCLVALGSTHCDGFEFALVAAAAKFRVLELGHTKQFWWDFG